MRPGGKTPRQRRRGLRGRLRWAFTLVAVCAVLLTSWISVSAGFRAVALFAADEPSVMSGPLAPIGPGSAEVEYRLRAVWEELDTETRELLRGVARDAGRQVLRGALLAALMASVLAVVAATLLTRQLTAPLTRLSEGARRLEGGERGLRLPVPQRDDEMRDLTVAFNSFVESLERQEAWRRSLVADVAHDLRTPLAVLRAEVEAMQDGVSTPDGPGLARLHAEVLLLSRLVDDLRTLSLAEGGALSLRPQDLDLRGLLLGVAGGYEQRFASAGMTLSVAAPQGVSVRADRDRLAQVLHNLLDNTLRYAGQGEVRLEGRAEGESAVVMVRDHGPGLNPETLARAFERFYRGDAARSRDLAGRAGSGLGLGIARALVEAQGGQVEASNHPEGGAVFTLRMPLAG